MHENPTYKLETFRIFSMSSEKKPILFGVESPIKTDAWRNSFRNQGTNIFLTVTGELRQLLALSPNNEANLL